MFLQTVFIIFTCTVVVIWSAPSSSIKIRNFECFPNETWLEKTECYMKAQRNQTVRFYIRTFLKKEVVAGKLRIQVFKWFNGFRPYFIDFWIDTCKALADMKSMNPFKTLVVRTIADNSNVNHSCPFSGEIIAPMVEPNLLAYVKFFPSGTYRMIFTFAEKLRRQVIFSMWVKSVISNSADLF